MLEILLLFPLLSQNLGKTLLVFASDVFFFVRKVGDLEGARKTANRRRKNLLL